MALISHFSKQTVGIRSESIYLFIIGLIFILLGAMGLGMIINLTLASMFFFGIALLIVGISQITEVFNAQAWKTVLWHALICLLYISTGLVVLYDPFFSSALITMLLGSLLLAIGITRCCMTLWVHQNGRGWLFFSGGTAILLGLIIITQWPWSGLWFLGVYIALELLISGCSFILIALTVHSR